MFQRQGSQEQRRRKMWKNLVIQSKYDSVDYLAKREAEAMRIAALAEDGKIAIMVSGMDADCVKYSGRATVVPATFMHVRQYIDREYEYAEGVMSFSTQRPSKANVKWQSRDLAMEAHENGHPHVVYA